MNDTPDTSPEAVALFRALDQIDELNKLPPDEEGYRWDNSDLIAQEVVGARSALRAMSTQLSELSPYKDELLKIAEAVGEGSDPFAAWEAIEALSAALEQMTAIKDIHQVKRHEYFERAEAAEAERDALKAELAEAVGVLTLIESIRPMWEGGVRGPSADNLSNTLEHMRAEARAFVARHQKETDT